MGSDKAPGKSKGLLFVHTTGPTHVHSRDKATKTKIRRHVMYEIGRSRRRPPRNQEFEVIMPPVESTDESTAEELTGPQTLQRPFSHQDPLSMLAEQWGMDAFSAYGISLLVAGVTSSSTPGASPSGTFFFPFAFTSSKLLAHFRSLFTNPTMLRLLHQQASARGRVLALDRYLGTISCVQNTISNPSSGHADRDKIARAVLATICYNLLQQDYGQARTHLLGLKSIIAAGGGVQRLDNDHDLRMMIFWIDVTLMLLFNTMPQYPLPPNLPLAASPSELVDALPVPLSRLMKAAEPRNDARLAHVASCMASLNLAAASIESELVMKGSTLYDDEIFLGLRLNPIAHRLFDPVLTTLRSATADLDNVVEMVRLGGILWVIWIKRISRSYPGSPMGYVSELLGLLNAQGLRAVHGVAGDSDGLPIILWLACICAISSPHGSTEWRQARGLMADALQTKETRCPDIAGNGEVWASMRQMPWISLFEKPVAEVLAGIHD